jgi:hypothetical protein
MKSPFQIWEPPISPAPPTKRTRIGGAGSPLHGPRHILDSRRSEAATYCCQAVASDLAALSPVRIKIQP